MNSLPSTARFSAVTKLSVEDEEQSYISLIHLRSCLIPSLVDSMGARPPLQQTWLTLDLPAAVGTSLPPGHGRGWSADPWTLVGECLPETHVLGPSGHHAAEREDVINKRQTCYHTVCTCLKIAWTLHSKSAAYFSLSLSSCPQNSERTFSKIIGLPSSSEGGAPSNLGMPSPLSSTRIQWIT